MPLLDCNTITVHASNKPPKGRIPVKHLPTTMRIPVYRVCFILMLNIGRAGVSSVE